MRYGCPPVSGVHRGSPPGTTASPTRTVKGRGDTVLGELAPSSFGAWRRVRVVAIPLPSTSSSRPQPNLC